MTSLDLSLQLGVTFEDYNAEERWIGYQAGSDDMKERAARIADDPKIPSHVTGAAIRALE
jgi:hypothetical protein